MKLKNTFFISFIFIPLGMLLLLHSCSAEDPTFTTAKCTSPSKPTSEDVTYSITFNATWSRVSHPTDFPANAHFSPIVGMLHNSSTSLFEIGTKASKGIKNMAEEGKTSRLVAEIKEKIKNGTANQDLVGRGISSSTGTTSITCIFQKSHALISIASMIAPSPDWFVSVSNVALFENGAWVDRKEVDVSVYDAGTEVGNTFNFDNASENGTIHRITTPPLAKNGTVPSMGKFIFVKQ